MHVRNIHFREEPLDTPVVRTSFSLSRHGDINVVSVPLQALTLAIVMYEA